MYWEVLSTPTNSASGSVRHEQRAGLTPPAGSLEAVANRERAQPGCGGLAFRLS
jgi:hypothetical protein